MNTIKCTTRDLAAILVLCSSGVFAQSNELVGDWTIVTTGFSFVGSSTSYLQLTVEESDGVLSAYVYNGPVPFRVNGNEFEFDLDWRSGCDV